MTKDIKDYLHLYLGCEVEVTHEKYLSGKYTGKLIGIDETEALVEYKGDGWEDIYILKPILRPLSSMTEEEFRQEFYDKWWDELCGVDFIKQYDNVKQWDIQDVGIAPKSFVFLLSKQFDLFGLIESGLALDATKLEKEK